MEEMSTTNTTPAAYLIEAGVTPTLVREAFAQSVTPNNPAAPTVVLYSYTDDSTESVFSVAVFATRMEAMYYADQGLRDLADLIGVANVHPEQCNPVHDYDDRTNAWKSSTWTADAEEFRPDEPGIYLRCTIRVEPFEFGRTYGDWDCVDSRTLTAQAQARA